mgnify:CR=1 FL=1
MSKSSKTKGKVGEREFAQFLRNHGIEARRGAQYSGSPDSPDVVSSLPYHFEVKRVEKLNVHDAYAQAQSDAGAKTPVVAFRRNHGAWMICLSAEHFLALTTGGSRPGIPCQSSPTTTTQSSGATVLPNQNQQPTKE